MNPWTNKRTSLGMCIAAAVAIAVGLFLVGGRAHGRDDVFSTRIAVEAAR
jgi:hypothetical protein